MHRHFCSLWDRNYCAKGIALAESLQRHSSEPYTLSVLCMDTDTYVLLYDMQLPNVELIPLSTFERAMHLEKIRESRTHQEWYWTAASQLLEYLLPWCGPDGLTYLDADTFAFADLKIVFDEIGDRSIGITPHRFPANKKHMEINGRFNVGLVHIRRSVTGHKCIERWAAQTRAWCYNRIEGQNACGDQKFLDEWSALYGDEVCSIANIGVNTAPWNVNQYAVTEGPRVDGVPVVLYHYHEFDWPADGPLRLTNYSMRKEDKEFIYFPYLQAYEAASIQIARVEALMEERQKAMELQAERA